MKIAQELYEGVTVAGYGSVGLITYMRTDSTRISEEARAAEVERLKKAYLDNPTPKNYLELLYNVPVGFELTARMTTNYRQLKTIYAQRRTHRLEDWHTFCDFIEKLPYAKELICTD